MNATADVLIVTDGCADLVDVCLASLRRATPAASVKPTVVANGRPDHDLEFVVRAHGAHYVPNRLAPRHHAAHGAGLHVGRAAGVGLKADYVVILDNDTLVLTPTWWEACVEALTQPHVGLWGCAWPETTPHPLCLGMRAPLFRLARTFLPTAACDTMQDATAEILGSGWQARLLPPDPHPWRGARIWRDARGTALLAHLGGGTHSQWDRLTWPQRLRRAPALWRRWRFLRAARAWLRSPLPSGQGVPRWLDA